VIQEEDRALRRPSWRWPWTERAAGKQQESAQAAQDGGSTTCCILLWRAGRGHSPWRAQGRKASESDDDREPGIAFRTCSKVPS